MVDAATVVSLIGALGLGSVGGQYAASSGQRRQTRANVLKALSDTETARWVNGEPRDPSFITAMRELETAALIARLPREVVRHYRILATAAYWASSEDWEETPDTDDAPAGAIESNFGDLVREAAREVSHLVWSPLIGRLRMASRIKKREAKFEKLRQPEARMIKRAGEYVGV